jgi:hypothetical protein
VQLRWLDSAGQRWAQHDCAVGCELAVAVGVLLWPLVADASLRQHAEGVQQACQWVIIGHCKVYQ